MRLSLLSNKIRVGRFAAPVWLIAAAGLAVVAAAGQAVGPVLQGSVTGSASIVAEQSVVLDEDRSTITNGHGDDSLLVENDEGTSFTAAIEMHVGDTGTSIDLAVTNVSNDDANVILELNVPAGIDVEVATAEDGGADALDSFEAQMGKGTWLLKVNPGSDDFVKITVEPRDDAKPGFYTITGRIVQIGG